MMTRLCSPVGPYSHEVETNGLFFVTGKHPEEQGNRNDPSIDNHAQAVLDDLKRELTKCGWTFADVVT